MKTIQGFVTCGLRDSNVADDLICLRIVDPNQRSRLLELKFTPENFGLLIGSNRIIKCEIVDSHWEDVKDGEG